MFQVIFQTKSIQRMGFLIVMKTHIPDHLLYQGSYVHKDNLVLSTGLTMWIGHCKEIQKLTLRALALHWSESRNCGLCVAYIQKDGSTLLVCKDTVRIKSADLKNNFFVLEFCGSPCFLDQCKERPQTAMCCLEWLTACHSQHWENITTQAIHQDLWSFQLYLSQCHLLHNLHSLQKVTKQQNREMTRRPIPRTPSWHRERWQKRI